MGAHRRLRAVRREVRARFQAGEMTPAQAVAAVLDAKGRRVPDDVTQRLALAPEPFDWKGLP